MCRSEPHTAVARTRISTSPGPGRGTGTDLTCVPAGPATGFVLTTAVIRDGSPALFFFKVSDSRFPIPGLIPGLVVPDVTGARAGRGRGLFRGDRLDVSGDDLAGVRHGELLEEERELRLERSADRLPSTGRQVPDLLLEHSDRLLAGLVEKLALGLALLLLVRHPLEEPALDLPLERKRKRGMVVNHVLELGSEMNLGAVVIGKAAEEFRRQGGGAVLDGAGQV